MNPMPENAADRPPSPRRSGDGDNVAVDLTAVVVAVTGNQPCVLTVEEATALPSGPFEHRHRSLQAGLRRWVEQQTGHRLGYTEQLYTFADRDRIAGGRAISISYLGLTCKEEREGSRDPAWRSWYDYFPWEDHRAGTPSLLPGLLEPRLKAWAEEAEDTETRDERRLRAAITFGFDGRPWNEELVLQRYELLYEAMLVEEAMRDRAGGGPALAPGRAMIADHRRILATGIARLRTKIKYRPMVFELMPPAFTLLQLQLTVEALAGRLVHKQNFRRLIEQQELVEETGEMSTQTRGRPAKLFCFRQAVLMERTVAGTRLPLMRS